MLRILLAFILGFKFRKRVRIFPWLTLNLSRKGISTTIGVPGLSINKNSKGTFLNVGLPGTGIYNRIKIDNDKSDLKKKIYIKPISKLYYKEPTQDMECKDKKKPDVNKMKELIEKIRKT